MANEQILNHQQSGPSSDNNKQEVSPSSGESASYWKARYQQLSHDYDHLQSINQNLEEKLLNVVEVYNKKENELVASIEHEKTTLMADVNKLSTKLVDARIKLHDYEEKEMLHASNCDAPCHRECQDGTKKSTNLIPKETAFMQYDPNLV